MLNGYGIYDVVGIGFGPSNLSLAIALEEHWANGANGAVAAAFFERQPSFGWHRNMLLPSTTMQVTFLKDLATFRNPVSRFSFVSYLHEAGRLAKFANNQSFFPTRHEFHQYLEWAASSFTDRVFYRSQVTGIRLPAGAGPEDCDHLQIDVSTGGAARVINARNVAISTGIVPRMPDGVERGERVWHSSEFLDRYSRTNPAELDTVLVLGAGQSAAEITRYLHANLPGSRVISVIPSYGYSIADDTPFANQVFDPGAIDEYYFGTDRTREAFWRYHRNTNYSVVDSDVITDLYQRSYDEEVSGDKRLQFLNLTRVNEVKQAGTRTYVSFSSLLDGHAQELEVDAVVCATGYDTMDPAVLLGDLDPYCLRDDAGRYRVQRDYRLVTTAGLRCGIYLQGGTEHSHGLTSSLLSNTAIRSGEIADSIIRQRAGQATAVDVLSAGQQEM